ncbi:1,4-alpha-glucan branching protein [Nocardia sp. NPDC057227]|uniref:maltokinase N-terminal cap-like domain-containing protein n=1 Tax=Nocardia sp. NPDC057227 TaxID=3346056 RepID=UPI003625FC32
MAIVHRTTLVPSKLELLAAWLPRQPWYAGQGELHRAGGFRLDDPAGAVGIEIVLVTDGDGRAFLTPMTYRDAPLPDALIGTTEHGVLGTRYVHDAPADPVFRAQLAALVRGEVAAQAQQASDTPDPTVLVGPAPDATDIALVRAPEPSDADPAPGEIAIPWTLPDGTTVRGIIARVR